MNYRLLPQEERDALLKKDLEHDKVNILEKFQLFSTPSLIWVSRNENAFEHKYFKHNFLIKHDVIEIVFRIYELCRAKVTYFKSNIDKYEPYIYHPKTGFSSTALWNTEFLKHKASGYIIDLRFLQRITRIEDFKEFYMHLETFEK